MINQSNSLIAEYSYDSWGRMRNPSTWASYAPGLEPDLMIADRGFTGHEHLKWFKLINMNGRVYDPLTGQFLSPDNYVQAPDYTQGYNRYSYCLNNPLKYTDPSGFTLEDLMHQSYYGSYNSWIQGQGPIIESAGYRSSRVMTQNDFDNLSNSKYGGRWDEYSGLTYFGSYAEGVFYGCIYNEYHNSWGSTAAGGIRGAISSYKSGQSLQYLTASLLDGTGVVESVGNISPDGLIRYINTNFGKRLPNNVSIRWLVWDKDFGLTMTANILNKNANLTVSIPNGFLNDPKGFLYDCVDHEIVHVNDFASGRALNWFIMYDWPVKEAIMDYRAYSRNQWYSITYRNGLYDYSSQINKARESLPPGWK